MMETTCNTHNTCFAPSIMLIYNKHAYINIIFSHNLHVIQISNNTQKMDFNLQTQKTVCTVHNQDHPAEIPNYSTTISSRTLVATRIPDSTRLADPSRSPVYSDIFNYLLKTFCLCYSIFDFLIKRKHFILGKPIYIYNFKRLITFTFNKMHLQNKSSKFKLFYKISMFERNGVNEYDGAYSAILSLLL